MVTFQTPILIVRTCPKDTIESVKNVVEFLKEHNVLDSHITILRLPRKGNEVVFEQKLNEAQLIRHDSGTVIFCDSATYPSYVAGVEIICPAILSKNKVEIFAIHCTERVVDTVYKDLYDFENDETRILGEDDIHFFTTIKDFIAGREFKHVDTV
jgi:hypothetical protein